MTDLNINPIAKPDAKPAEKVGISESRHRKLREATRAFEAIFVKELLKVATPKMAKGLFGGGMAEEFFQDFMLDERSKAMVEGGGVGLAKMLEKEILSLESRKVKNDEPKTDKDTDLYTKRRAQQAYQPQ